MLLPDSESVHVAFEVARLRRRAERLTWIVFMVSFWGFFGWAILGAKAFGFLGGL